MRPFKIYASLTSCRSSLFDYLLPRHCVLCGRPSGQENLCAPCHADLPRLNRACPGCALPVYGRPAQPCGQCLVRPPPWTHALAALEYRYPADWLVRRFKFNRDFACGQVLGLEMIAAIRRSTAALPDFLVPVPLHGLRHFGRTFNQSDLLARQVSRSTGIPVRDRLLLRRRRTHAQSGLDAIDRRRNIRGAFRCERASGPLLAGAHIGLIDDVMTTGATVAECAKTLRQARAACVTVWVAARAPAP